MRQWKLTRRLQKSQKTGVLIPASTTVLMAASLKRCRIARSGHLKQGSRFFTPGDGSIPNGFHEYAKPGFHFSNLSAIVAAEAYEHDAADAHHHARDIVPGFVPHDALTKALAAKSVAVAALRKANQGWKRADEKVVKLHKEKEVPMRKFTA